MDSEGQSSGRKEGHEGSGRPFVRKEGASRGGEKRPRKRIIRSGSDQERKKGYNREDRSQTFKSRNSQGDRSYRGANERNSEAKSYGNSKRYGDHDKPSYGDKRESGHYRSNDNRKSFGDSKSFEGRERRTYNNERSGDYKERRSYGTGKPRFGGDDSRHYESRGDHPYHSNDHGDNRTGSRDSRGGAGRKFDTRDKYVRGDRRDQGRRYSRRNADDYVQKRKLVKLQKTEYRDTTRLNKYLAHAGVASRREADVLITQGVVQVNGKVVTEMGYQVQKDDVVTFDGRQLKAEKLIYLLMNKPKGYISTTQDEKMRKTVIDLIANEYPYRIYPVGRLDRSTTGVLLLTNDGQITEKLTHPSFEIHKIYHVVLDKKMSLEDMQTIQDGIRLEEGVAEVDSISFIDGSPKNEVGIELHLGWNRVVRRIFQRLGYEVEKLDRVSFAGFTKKNVKRGHWRELTELEVNRLKML